jgi:hypothetical protein
MKRIIFPVVLLLCGTLSAQSVFFDTYPEATSEVNRVYQQMEELHKLPNDKGKIIFSIVAPEVAMYSSFIDELETVSAEVFYTSFGKEYGNFSVGQFQMKPSFAEDVERAYAAECEACVHFETLQYPGLSDESEIRSARLDRLKMDTWQQVYLLCFYEIMEARHGHKRMTTEERIRYYAAAYNLGFNKSETCIQNWMNEISFPGNMHDKLVSYSDLAGDFLLVLCPDLKNETLAEIELQAEFENKGLAGAEQYLAFSGNPVNLHKENGRVRVLPYILPLVFALFLTLIFLFIRGRVRKRAARRLTGRMRLNT